MLYILIFKLPREHIYRGSKKIIIIITTNQDDKLKGNVDFTLQLNDNLLIFDEILLIKYHIQIIMITVVVVVVVAAAAVVSNHNNLQVKQNTNYTNYQL